MNDDFATAMGRALDLTRAGSPIEATRLIQDALNIPTPATTGPQPAMAGQGAGRRLGQVVDALASARKAMAASGQGARPMPAIPTGARYEARRHDSAFGARDYRLFLPSSREAAPQGLVLMLHGCTQNADDFAVGTQMNPLAEAHNLIVVYPEQSRAANQMGCWNWFQPEHQRRGGGEPALLDDLARTIAGEFAIDRRRIYVAGLSAGGAMAAILGQAYPETFAAVGVHSGLAPGAASDMASAFAAMRAPSSHSARKSTPPVRSIVFHGSADSTVSPANADAVIAAALGSRPATELILPVRDGASVTLYQDQSGATVAEKWSLAGLNHAWSGGAAEGSYTDPKGRDASAEMLRFFLAGSHRDQD